MEIRANYPPIWVSTFFWSLLIIDLVVVVGQAFSVDNFVHQQHGYNRIRLKVGVEAVDNLLVICRVIHSHPQSVDVDVEKGKSYPQSANKLSTSYPPNKTGVIQALWGASTKRRRSGVKRWSKGEKKRNFRLRKFAYKGPAREKVEE